MTAVRLYPNLVCRLVDLAEDIGVDVGLEVAGWVTLRFDSMQEGLQLAEDHLLRSSVSQTDARLVRLSGPVSALVDVLRDYRAIVARKSNERSEGKEA